MPRFDKCETLEEINATRGKYNLLPCRRCVHNLLTYNYYSESAKPVLLCYAPAAQTRKCAACVNGRKDCIVETDETVSQLLRDLAVAYLRHRESADMAKTFDEFTDLAADVRRALGGAKSTDPAVKKTISSSVAEPAPLLQHAGDLVAIGKDIAVSLRYLCDVKHAANPTLALPARDELTLGNGDDDDVDNGEGPSGQTGKRKANAQDADSQRSGRRQKTDVAKYASW